jgi:hypothetical protein
VFTHDRSSPAATIQDAAAQRLETENHANDENLVIADLHGLIEEIEQGIGDPPTHLARSCAER